MNGSSQVKKTTAPKASPITTQEMWEMAYDDFAYADVMVKVIRGAEGATPKDIAARERVRRTRMAIATAIDFLITHSDVIDAVMQSNKKG